MFPEDCLQSVLPSGTQWWVPNENRELCRGALVWSFAPHVDQIPYIFEPVARAVATEHGAATVRVAPLKVGQPLKQVDLPVAAMPTYAGEVWGAYRAKRRPCLVFGCGLYPVPSELIRGKPKHATAPTFIGAPFYGVDASAKRAGYNPTFVERVRHCEYPRFHWDKLPLPGGPNESILRLDHLQPFGMHHDSHQVTEFKLSDQAMALLDDMLQWQLWGGLPSESPILDYQELIAEMFP